MGSEKKNSIFMHPISLNYLQENNKIVGLRLIGIHITSNIANQLHSWKTFIGQAQSYSFPADMVIQFVAKGYLQLTYIDLRVRDLSSFLSSVGLSLNNMYPFQTSLNLNNLGIKPPESVVCNSADSCIFQMHLYLLLPSLAAINRQEMGYGLSVDNFGLTSKILFYNNSPVCYISSKEYALMMKHGNWNINGDILECNIIKERKLLCAGRGRHIPAKQGLSFMLNVSNGLVTKYTGVLSSCQFVAINKVFDSAVFQWVTTQKSKITDVCGTK